MFEIMAIRSQRDAGQILGFPSTKPHPKNGGQRPLFGGVQISAYRMRTSSNALVAHDFSDSIPATVI